MSSKAQISATLTDHELAEIASLVEKRTGLLFDESRLRFFSTRLREHMESKQLARGTDLLRLMKNSNVEYEAVIESLLTQETSFYRYPHVFEALEKKILPELHVKKFWENPRTLRIWCAGCSTGEEPYSIAITLGDALEYAESWNLHILATDISRRALQHAERGVYGRRSLGSLNPKQIESAFAKVGDQFMIKPRIRNMVTFAQMNLNDSTYLGRFDLILCMNVLIYFSPERRNAVIQRLYDALEPGGYLCLGHAESASTAGLKLDTKVHGDVRLYQKPENNGTQFRTATAEGNA